MIRIHLASHWLTLELSLVADMLRSQHCTDDHDRVYGLLGLFGKSATRADCGIYFRATVGKRLSRRLASFRRV